MSTLTTVQNRRFGDSWSFRGLGRKLYAHTRKAMHPIEPPATLAEELPDPEADLTAPVHEEAPTGPSEPRG